jgi:DNA-binding CsgD family transcriptional regulator
VIDQHRTIAEGEDAFGLLALHAHELYDDARLMPMLRKLVSTTAKLADAVGGSVSLVDLGAGHYTKIAEMGTACRLGQSFPLHEGVTGQVVRRRAPVVLGAYHEIAGGHLNSDHPAFSGAVVAIPIWWRTEIVAVNVIFAGSPRSYTAAEIDYLELVTQVAAPGVVTAVNREMPQQAPTNGHRNAYDPAMDLGTDPDAVSVNRVLSGLIEITHRASHGMAAPIGNFELRVMDGDTTPRLLVRSDSSSNVTGTDVDWQELVDTGVGVVDIHPVQADLCVQDAALESLPTPAVVVEADSPLTGREREVGLLLSQGLTDRGIAKILGLSPKTVEKYVSSLRRKTDTASRTAAVVRCMEHGWI